MALTIKVACPKHPRYGATKAPRNGCSLCAEVWRFRKTTLPVAVYAEFSPEVAVDITPVWAEEEM